jgi:hypothetical protein
MLNGNSKRRTNFLYTAAPESRRSRTLVAGPWRLAKPPAMCGGLESASTQCHAKRGIVALMLRRPGPLTARACGVSAR